MLLDLFLSFMKIGFFAVGGGLATLPFLYELAQTKPWITVDDITRLVAISESTPGPLGVNMATYSGFIGAGPLGAITAPLGLVLPSIIVIILIANVFEKFKKNKLVADVFYMLRPASVALVTVAGLNVAKIALINDNGVFWQGLILALAVILLMKKFKLHPIFYILFSGVIGIIFNF